MRTFLTLTIAVTLAISALLPMQKTLAQDDNTKAMEAEMMKKWQDYSTPGEEHKVLEQFIGDWDYTVKWWQAPGAEPVTSKGESEIEWELGGRYITAEVEGMTMGKKFEGFGLTGYDKAKKEYQNIWIDNMGTGMMVASGQYDAATKTLTEKGSYTDPITEKDMTFTGVTKFIDKDNYTYELFMQGPDGKEFKMMEITYTRDK